MTEDEKNIICYHFPTTREAIEAGFLEGNKARDFIIRIKFRQMRKEKIKAGTAIDKLREEYPYLQFDSLRKIVYQLGQNRGVS